jgi:hypothetical protein
MKLIKLYDEQANFHALVPMDAIATIRRREGSKYYVKLKDDDKHEFLIDAPTEARKIRHHGDET